VAAPCTAQARGGSLRASPAGTSPHSAILLRHVAHESSLRAIVRAVTSPKVLDQHQIRAVADHSVVEDGRAIWRNRDGGGVPGREPIEFAKQMVLTRGRIEQVKGRGSIGATGYVVETLPRHAEGRRLGTLDKLSDAAGPRPRAVSDGGGDGGSCRFTGR